MITEPEKRKRKSCSQKAGINPAVPARKEQERAAKGGCLGAPSLLIEVTVLSVSSVQACLSVCLSGWLSCPLRVSRRSHQPEEAVCRVAPLFLQYREYVLACCSSSGESTPTCSRRHWISIAAGVQVSETSAHKLQRGSLRWMQTCTRGTS